MKFTRRMSDMSDKLFTDCCLNEKTDQGFDTGKPTQIIGLLDDELIFNEENLEKILLKTSKPILVISIVGAFRTGKSFLLSSFIQYVKNSYQTTNKEPEQNINKSDGFDWSYGSDAHTKGVWLWDTPLSYNLNGQEVSLLFMDTQGIFDNGSSQKDCSIIFSLSSFMSSVQILNLKNNIEKRDLEYLSIFAQFKQISEKQLNNIFQYEQLTFLIRDWNFPDENGYGFQGGEKLLNDRLELCTSKSSSNKELNDLLSNLKNQFKKRNCFLMPYPGGAISKKTFDGDSKLLTTEFNESCELFFKETIKRINFDKNRPNLFRDGRYLFNILKDYVKVLKSKSLPDMESITTIYYKHNNLMCRQIEHKSYNDEMIEFLSNQKPFVKMDDLETVHESLVNKCLKNYNMYKMGQETSDNDFLNIINKCYEEYKNSAKVQNKKEIISIQKVTISQYTKIMNEFCGDESIYKPSLEIFLKHQQTKTDCLRKIKSYRNWTNEVEIALIELNENVDNILKTFDDKNYLKRKKTIETIISKCIEKYKEHMELKLKEKGSYIDSDNFHQIHLFATEKCVKEFEVLSQNYKDIRNEFDIILSKEIDILYSNFKNINADRKSKLTIISNRVKGFIMPYVQPSQSRNDENDTSKKKATKSIFFNNTGLNILNLSHGIILLGQNVSLIIFFVFSICWGLILNVCMSFYTRSSQDFAKFLKVPRKVLKNAFIKSYEHLIS